MSDLIAYGGSACHYGTKLAFIKIHIYSKASALFQNLWQFSGVQHHVIMCIAMDDVAVLKGSLSESHLDPQINQTGQVCLYDLLPCHAT